MFIVFLRFSDNKGKAKELMAAHKAWIQKGVEEDLFLLVGSIQPNQGGCIIVRDIERAALDARIDEDPFVVENVVTAEIHEVSPSIANQKLQFLMTE